MKVESKAKRRPAVTDYLLLIPVALLVFAVYLWQASLADATVQLAKVGTSEDSKMQPLTEKRPELVSIISDPVFSSGEWTAFTDLSKEFWYTANQDYLTGLDSAAKLVFWPGESGKAKSAVKQYKERFTNDELDRSREHSMMMALVYVDESCDTLKTGVSAQEYADSWKYETAVPRPSAYKFDGPTPGEPSTVSKDVMTKAFQTVIAATADDYCKSANKTS